MKRLLLPLAALAFGGGVIAAVSARADAPSFGDQVRSWASGAGYRVTLPESCEGQVEKAFGGTVVSCFSARLVKKVDGLHPRMNIVEASYASEAGAKARVGKLCSAPPGEDIDDEGHKAYPLRAAFRLNDRVIVITTDAFAFRPDIDRAAAALATETGGTDVTRWSDCR